MGLKEGTLQSLIGGWEASVTDLAHSLFHQMLQALDCLAVNGIVHRDVKPENILYVSRPNAQYRFQLGDFGLSNRAISAATFAGSPLYMAPEMFQKGPQTHKVDVWSLFVTMLWTLDVKGFRRKSERFKTLEEVHKEVATAASGVEIIREMAEINPEERASAAQMLVKCFDGGGLTTLRSQVPALLPVKAKTTASADNQPASMARPTRRNARGGPSQAPDAFRVRKPRHSSQSQRPDAAPRKRPAQANNRPVGEPPMPGGFPGNDDNFPE